MTIRRILTHLERISTSQLDSARDAPVSLASNLRSIINQSIIMTTERNLTHLDARRSKSHESAPVSQVRQVRSTYDRPLLAARSAVRRSQWHLELQKFSARAGLPAQSLHNFPTQNAGGPGKSIPTENPRPTRVELRGTNSRRHRTNRARDDRLDRTDRATTASTHRALNKSLGPTRRRSSESFLQLLKPYTSSMHRLRSKSTHLPSLFPLYTTSCCLLLLTRCNYRTFSPTSKNHR